MGDRTRHPAGTPARLTAVGEILRRWPVVLLITVLAVAAALVATLVRDGSHAARVGLIVTPVAQYDETFLGTGLVRDGGDAARTATTLATTLETREADAEAARRLGAGWSAESVADAVRVTAVDGANVVEITGTDSDEAAAARLATTFAAAVLDARWRAIAPELRERIATLDELRDATTGPAVLLRDRAILATTLAIGRDPTLRLQDAAPELSEEGPGTSLLLLLALLGGLIVGSLAALAMAHPWRGGDDGSPPRESDAHL